MRAEVAVEEDLTTALAPTMATRGEAKVIHDVDGRGIGGGAEEMAAG